MSATLLAKVNSISCILWISCLWCRYRNRKVGVPIGDIIADRGQAVLLAWQQELQPGWEFSLQITMCLLLWYQFAAVLAIGAVRRS